jgi:hypothetical protein
MGRHEEKQIKEDDFKNCGCRNEKGRIGDGGKEGYHLKKNESDPIIDMDQ